MESVFLVTTVVAAVEFLKRVQLKDYFAALTIFVAGAIGCVAGIMHAPGVPDAWVGIVTGLGASGLVTVASKVGVFGGPTVRK